jgi:hypothetical protein
MLPEKKKKKAYNTELFLYCIFRYSAPRVECIHYLYVVFKRNIVLVKIEMMIKQLFDQWDDYDFYN